MSITPTRERLFAEDWLITHDYEEEVLGIVKAGKESEVSLIARTDATRTCYIAEKRFKSRMFRSFQEDSHYREDRYRGPGGARVLRGIRRGRDAGHRMLEGGWIAFEWEALARLYEAGVTVPPPVDRIEVSARASRTTRVEEAEGGYRMAFVGDPPVAAPRLTSVHMDRDTAAHAWQLLLEEIALMLRADHVHGDLSAYNVLWWRDRPVIIDFSQTVSVITHSSARQLLRRDLEQCARWAVRQGVDADVDRAWKEIGAERGLEGR